MFSKAIVLPFKLLGIPIKLDRSFLIVLPLFTFLIGSQIPAYAQLFARGVNVTALETGATPYILGFIAAVGLFTSVLIHELGHAVTARFYGVKTKEITLWFLGGLAMFNEMPKQKGAEAVTAIAGPITSFLLAGICWLLFQNTGANAAILFILGYLSVTNLALGLFNLLPALPLDGGRVLRSLLALRFGHARATKISGISSRVIAVLLGIWGLLNGQIFIAAIAFFIFTSVRSETQQADITESLSALKIRDVMTTDVDTVYPDMPLDQFLKLQHYKHHKGYPVINNQEQLIGYAKLQDAIQEDNKGNSFSKTVKDITQVAQTIFENDNALSSLKLMTTSATDRYIVINEAGKMVGLVSKSDFRKTLSSAKEH